MLKFLKYYNLRIIALIAIAIFILDTRGEAIDLTTRNYIRVPLVGNSENGKDRLTQGWRNLFSRRKVIAVIAALTLAGEPLSRLREALYRYNIDSRNFSYLDPASMVKDFLRKGSDIIIFGERHYTMSQVLVIKDIIDSLEEGEINYLALETEVSSNAQTILDEIIANLEHKKLKHKTDEEIKRQFKEEVDNLIKKHIYAGITLLEQGTQTLIIAAYKKGIKIVLIDPRGAEAKISDPRSWRWATINGKKRNVDEVMAERVLNLKGRVIAVVGQEHAKKNHFSRLYGLGAHIASAGSIIKKNVPSAKIVLHIDERDAFFLHSLDLGKPVAVDLFDSPFSDTSMSPGEILGNKADAVILYPPRKAKKPISLSNSNKLPRSSL